LRSLVSFDDSSDLQDLVESDVTGSWGKFNFLSISLSTESSHLFDDVGRSTWLWNDLSSSVLSMDLEEDSASSPLFALLIDHGGKVFGLESQWTELLGHMSREVLISNTEEGLDDNEL
jgi:hypothetical protein